MGKVQAEIGAPEEITLQGVYKSAVFSSAKNAFCVVRVVASKISTAASSPPHTGDTVMVAGEIPFSLTEGLLLEIKGTWSQTLKYGYQVQLSQIALKDPGNLEGVVSYLSSGIIKGIGKVLAGRIVETFGAGALRILDEDPSKITEVHGIGPKKLAELVLTWPEQRGKARAIGHIMGIGISYGVAKKVLTEYGVNAMEIITANPYVLTKIRGIGFTTADKIALKAGFDPFCQERIEAAMGHTLTVNCEQKGNTFILRPALWKETVDLLVAAGEEKDRGAYLSAVKDYFKNNNSEEKAIVILNGVGLYVKKGDRVYLRSLYDAERRIGAAISAMMKKHCEDLNDNPFVEGILEGGAITLTEKQKNAVRTALNSRGIVITGLPGTGKTTIIRRIVDALNITDKTFVLCAPTGKAARRIEESTGHQAHTIHKLLMWRQRPAAKNEAGEGGEAANPFDVDFVIVDEFSMVDTVLLDRLMGDIGPNSRLVIVGDHNQLPSIGAGNCLLDLIESDGIHYVELDEIMRQAADSPIIQTAHRIHHGKSIQDLQMPGKLEFVHLADAEAVRNKVVELLKAIGVENAQILSPKKIGRCGSIEINALAQDSIIGGPNKSNATPFWFSKGDKVIHTRNNYQLGVMNGEVGIVEKINLEEVKLFIRFEDKTVEYDEETADQLMLAYAMSVHKAQGSDFHTVIFPVHGEQGHMLFKNLIYTAVTRAKERLIIVGDAKAFSGGVMRANISKRNTSLREFIERTVFVSHAI